MKVNDILDYLSAKFPLCDACDFDNVGLLVGSKNAEITKVLIALDCEISAVRKAVEIGAELIVTHHPVIFDGLKSVTDESLVHLLIKNNISVISMHTNFDMGIGGVNDILCEVLGLKNVKKYKAEDGFILNRCETEFSDADVLAENIKNSLNFPVRYVKGRPVKKLLVCSGSGGDFIKEANENGFDGLITADVKHNQFIYARNNNISLFDAGHFATENVCVKPLSKMLKSKFPKTEFYPFEPIIIKNV